MPLTIVRNDITKMKVDAIVNAANRTLLGGGGVDGCIHRAAGPELLGECRTLGGCETGGAKITKAYRLPCRYVIHAVGPVWHGGDHGERILLASCYRASLELAKKHSCGSVAFPLISSGAYGYPKDQALRVATDTICEFLMENDMDVFIVVFDRASFQISKELRDDIRAYIDDTYVGPRHDSTDARRRRRRARDEGWEGGLYAPPVGAPPSGEKLAPAVKPPSLRKPLSLDEALMELDESFQEMLLRKIDESGMTDSQCYRKANVSRQLFSKIRANRLYKPSKPTAIAFAIALGLSLDETDDLLKKAGFALSHSSKFDIIIEYFISHANYNIAEINEVLFDYDQPLLGF